MGKSKFQQDVKDFKVSKGYSYYVFLLLFFLYLNNYADRMVLASLLPYLKADWGLTDTQCGWLAASVTLMMTVFVFPVAVLADRWSRTKVVGIMALLWSLAALGCALTRNYAQLLTMRAAVGTGEAAYSSSGHAMIAAYFPGEKRATMNGIFSAAIPLGTAIGVILGGLIAETIGWRYAFGILAIPSLIAAIPFFWVKDYKTVAIVKTSINDQPGKANMKIVDIAKDFLHTPSVLFTYLGYTGATFVTVALMNWMPTYYHRVEGLPMDKAGLKTAVIFVLAIFGAPIGGFLTDKIKKKVPAARMAVPAAVMLLSAGFLFIAFSVLDGDAQYLLLILFGFTCPMFIAGASAVTQDVVQPGLRAISFALAVFFMMLLGQSLGPIFVGAISDRYDLLTAFKFLSLFAGVSGLAFFLGSFYYVRDFKKVEKLTLEG